jgi:hypothetical protein
VPEHHAGQRLDLEVAQRLLLRQREVADLRLREFDVLRCSWCEAKPGIAEISLRASVNAVSNCVFCAGWMVSTATSRIMSCPAGSFF